MGRLPRAIDDGLVYHALNRGKVFTDDGDRVAFLEALILFGIGLILTGGLLLLFVSGLSSMVPPDEPGYWRLVFTTMFGHDHGGWVAIPAFLGLLFGIVIVGCGIFRSNGKRSLGTIAKVILAAAVSLGTMILGLALSLHPGEECSTATTKQTRRFRANRGRG